MSVIFVSHFAYIFKVTMTGKKLAVFILLTLSMELLFCTVDAKPWFWRRRRRRATPPPPPPPPTTLAPTTPSCDSSIPQPANAPADFKWHNEWHQSFRAYCPYSKLTFHFISKSCSCCGECQAYSF